MLPDFSPPLKHPAANASVLPHGAFRHRLDRANDWADQTLPACVVSRIAPIDASAQAPHPQPAKSKRALEFSRGRAIAAELLSRFSPSDEVGVAADRSPIWPVNTTGSISHTDQWIWVAVSHQADLLSIGVDTEEMVNRETQRLLRNEIATPDEWTIANRLDLCDLTTFTLIFSAKEAFYKCCHPLTKTFFDFKDVAVEAIGQDSIRIRICDTKPIRNRLPAPLANPWALDVHFLIDTSHVFTASWIPTCNHPASKELS